MCICFPSVLGVCTSGMSPTNQIESLILLFWNTVCSSTSVAAAVPIQNAAQPKTMNLILAIPITVQLLESLSTCSNYKAIHFLASGFSQEHFLTHPTFDFAHTHIPLLHCICNVMLGTLFPHITNRGLFYKFKLKSYEHNAPSWGFIM